MANMRILIRIVFVIFIANWIDCLRRVCDDCCDCFKEKDENITAESLVNYNWYRAKNNLVLMIFKKEDDNGIFTSEGNEDKISFKLEGKDNPKIAYLEKKGDEDKLKLEDKKYALFEIKTKCGNTVYLYCSDVESSSENVNGIFEGTTHVSISVIACDTTNVTDMSRMFYECSSLKDLDIKKFNTTNIKDMCEMFSGCSNLKELDLKNFNTKNVTNMGYMFHGCSSFTKLDISNFNTENVTNMQSMFSNCSRLTELDISNFITTNVTDMGFMFSECRALTKLELGGNFNISNDKFILCMLENCKENIKNKILKKN